MVDVISTGDHAIKAQDNSALALLGPDALTEFRSFSRMMPQHDATTPILAGLTSDRDLLAQLTEDNASDHHPSDRLPAVVVNAMDRNLPAEGFASSDSAPAKPLTEEQAKQLVKDADREYRWAQGEAERIANGAQPTNPFVDLAYILVGGTTYDTRVNLGDVAAQAGDKKGAIAAYEDALSNYRNNPYNIVTGGDNPMPDPPEDLADKLKALGVSKEQALADIARTAADGHGF